MMLRVPLHEVRAQRVMARNVGPWPQRNGYPLRDAPVGVAHRRPREVQERSQLEPVPIIAAVVIVEDQPAHPPRESPAGLPSVIATSQQGMWQGENAFVLGLLDRRAERPELDDLQRFQPGDEQF